MYSTSTPGMSPRSFLAVTAVKTLPAPALRPIGVNQAIAVIDLQGHDIPASRGGLGFHFLVPRTLTSDHRPRIQPLNHASSTCSRSFRTQASGNL
jgi:hypothetical protein